MKYWEIIADNLSKAGWRWGCVSAINSNGRTSQWRHFAALRADSATSRDNEPYSANRKSASLHDSRRFTQFECPNLSEKLGARTAAEIAVKWWSS
jgi:hypothetical protein